MQDEKYLDAGILCIFCNELCDYIFIPYAHKLKNVPEYAANKEEFQDARIFLFEKESNQGKQLPCTVWESKKKVYLSEGNFNKNWGKISTLMIHAILENANELISQKDMNSHVDLSLVTTPDVDAILNEQGIIEYIQRKQDIEIQQMISKRALAMEDNSILYIFSSKDNLIHDKTCHIASTIPYWEFESSRELLKGKEICQHCKRKIYLRNALKNDAKHFALCLRMFDNGNVSTQDIFILTSEYHATLSMDKPDCINVKCGEDTWQIIMNEQGYCTLYHNNYNMINNTERYITTGYHQQNCPYSNLTDVLKYIEQYNWQKHLESRQSVAD